jgi:hypothetical protein
MADAMNSIPCKYLRTKSMYILTSPEEALADKDDTNTSPCFFWCNRTQTAVGHDDRPVHKAACIPTRSCFEQ